jgi:hypothetical protein
MDAVATSDEQRDFGRDPGRQAKFPEEDHQGNYVDPILCN